MMTRETVLKIEEYCSKHKVSYKQRLEELEMPLWDVYRTKQKYRQEESYKVIHEFENWMNSVSGHFSPKSRMGKALV